MKIFVKELLCSVQWAANGSPPRQRADTWGFEQGEHTDPQTWGLSSTFKCRESPNNDVIFSTVLHPHQLLHLLFFNRKSSGFAWLW